MDWQTLYAEGYKVVKSKVFSRFPQIVSFKNFSHKNKLKYTMRTKLQNDGELLVQNKPNFLQSFKLLTL